MGYRKMQSKSRGSGGGNRQRQGRANGGRPSTTTVVSTSSSNPDVRPLEINEETRWKPRSRSMNNNNIDESSEQRDARLVLLLLNKLTPQNFGKLVDAFVAETRIQYSSKQTRDTIHEIMQRASLDMRYTQVYARLCKRLATDLAVGGELLEYCRENVQSSAAALTTAESDLFEHPDEARVRLIIARQLNIGSKRFIGELLNHGALDVSDILSFVEILLNQAELMSATGEKNREVIIEGLCVLLDSCGKTLDETAIETQEMQRCWKTLEAMTTTSEDPETCHSQVSFRVRCLILDLLEFRESGWCPKRFSCRQRKEMIAKPLERPDQDRAARNSSRKSKKGGKRKGKSVQFAPK